MKIAVVGATGAVGREMLKELEEKKWHSFSVSAFASSKSQGKKIVFRDSVLTVNNFSVESLAGFDYVLMSAGGDFSKKYAETLSANGAIVIDNSSAWRMFDQIPLIVPEVNCALINDFNHGIIANPNCSTIQMVVSLKPLQDAFGLEQVHVTTLQSVSGAGQKGVEELINNSSRQIHDNHGEIFPQNIAYNVLPAIGPLNDSGHCQEELKMIEETRKILGNAKIEILATTSRVPVTYCHCESIYVKLCKEVKLRDVVEVFTYAEGLNLCQEDQAQMPTPLNFKGQKDVSVTRLRIPYSRESSQWVQYWNIADNLKKGAATNAIQILEYLVRKREN